MKRVSTILRIRQNFSRSIIRVKRKYEDLHRDIICVDFLTFMGVSEGHFSRQKLRARGAISVVARLHGGHAAREVCAVALNNPNQLIWCTPPY